MRCTTVIVFAVMLGTVSAGAQDVCSGATPKPMPRRMAAPAAAPTAGKSAAGLAIGAGGVGAARGVNMYPGSGTGPIPDVTDWKPRGKIPAGGELIIQGRGLVPGQFVAMLAGFTLTPTTQSTSEIRFRVTDPSDASPLVVYNTNGQPRTLESAYIAYDPTVVISRVVPSVFGMNDLVTVCGSSLFDAAFLDSYSAVPVDAGSQWSQVKTMPGMFVQVGGTWLSVVNPKISPAGDRVTFQAGQAFKSTWACTTARCNGPDMVTFIVAFSSPPASLTGALTIRFSGAGKSVAGPSVTWKGVAQAPPRITAVYGKVFGDRDPFVLLPTSNMQTNYRAQAYVDGMNLTDDVTWRIGTMTVSGGTSGPGMPTNGTYAIVSVPLNASSGTVCASSTLSTGCSPTPLQIFGGPVIASMPSMMPLTLRTSYTIQGLNLLPPSNITGLKYRWTAGMLALDSTATNLACNTVLQVLEHTANRIVFRIGDPAKTAPVPASCANSSLFQQSPNWTMNIQATLAGQQGVQLLLKQVPFYLKP
jgi:hypothetical protein